MCSLRKSDSLRASMYTPVSLLRTSVRLPWASLMASSGAIRTRSLSLGLLAQPANPPTTQTKASAAIIACANRSRAEVIWQSPRQTRKRWVQQAVYGRDRGCSSDRLRRRDIPEIAAVTALLAVYSFVISRVPGAIGEVSGVLGQ